MKRGHKSVVLLLVQIFGLVVAIPNEEPEITPQPRSGGCSFTHTFQRVGQQAYLRSPNWPNQYSHNSDCKYSLSSPRNSNINMNCTEVNIEFSNGCIYDRMTVSVSGDSSLRDGQIVCGQGTFTRKSRANALEVGFKSDSTNPSSSAPFRFQCLLTVVESLASTTSSPLTSSRPAAGGGNGNAGFASDGFSDQTCSCGTRNEATRIVGGTNARTNEFPWRIALYSPSLGVFCGATVISQNWIMTAAHCTRPVRGRTLYANVGDHDLSSTKETQNEVIKCSQIVEHPNYNNRTQDNDLALCRLERPLTFSRRIQPVCLPWSMASETFQGKTVTASGWGTTTSGGSSSPILKKVDLPVLTTQECSRYYRGAVTDNMICTYSAGKDTCQGDSGGSIDYREPNSNRYFGVGVVSWGVGCAGVNQPGVYTKVTNYLRFIQSNTGGERFCR